MEACAGKRKGAGSAAARWWGCAPWVWWPAGHGPQAMGAQAMSETRAMALRAQFQGPTRSHSGLEVMRETKAMAMRGGPRAVPWVWRHVGGGAVGQVRPDPVGRIILSPSPVEMPAMHRGRPRRTPGRGRSAFRLLTAELRRHRALGAGRRGPGPQASPSGPHRARLSSREARGRGAATRGRSAGRQRGRALACGREGGRGPPAAPVRSGSPLGCAWDHCPGPLGLAAPVPGGAPRRGARDRCPGAPGPPPRPGVGTLRLWPARAPAGTRLRGGLWADCLRPQPGGAREAGGPLRPQAAWLPLGGPPAGRMWADSGCGP